MRKRFILILSTILICLSIWIYLKMGLHGQYRYRTNITNKLSNVIECLPILNNKGKVEIGVSSSVSKGKCVEVFHNGVFIVKYKNKYYKYAMNKQSVSRENAEIYGYTRHQTLNIADEMYAYVQKLDASEDKETTNQPEGYPLVPGSIDSIDSYLDIGYKLDF